MSNSLTNDLPVLASDYEQTIEMLKKENEKLRHALKIIEAWPTTNMATRYAIHKALSSEFRKPNDRQAFI